SQQRKCDEPNFLREFYFADEKAIGQEDSKYPGCTAYQLRENRFDLCRLWPYDFEEGRDGCMVEFRLESFAILIVFGYPVFISHDLNHVHVNVIGLIVN